MTKPLFILLRLLFGLSLVGLGILNLTKINTTEHRINTNIETGFKTLKLPKTYLQELKNYTNIIAYAEAFFLIMTGLLTSFRKCSASIYCILGFTIHLALINNPVFNKDINGTIKLISILGGVLMSS